MTDRVSPTTNKRYGRRRVCGAYGVPRSTTYASRYRQPKAQPDKRGPRTEVSDQELLQAVRDVIADRRFHGEGHKKIHACVRHREGLRVGRNRVLRLMRAHDLLAPQRVGPPNGPKAHDGTIITHRPDLMWGTDATRIPTLDDGWIWVFAAIDHHHNEIVGWHVAKIGDRYAAMEPVLQGVEKYFGPAGEKRVAHGLALRHDWGPQYISHHFKETLDFLGIDNSPTYVGEPQGNGVIERFFRTLKEQCVYCHQFRDVEDARRVIGRFIEDYNNHWMIQRLDYATPMQARHNYKQRQQVA